MQNKPNFRSAKINTTSFSPKIYTNIPLRPTRKNKAKTNPIPPHRESIENRVSSIKYPALFMQNKPNPGAIRDTQHAIRKTKPIKPNFKMGKMNISTVITKAYANEQRTINNERPSKQTQSNPIHPLNTLHAARYMPSAIRNTRIEHPASRICRRFTLLAQDDMNRDCFAEPGLEQANAANRKEVTPLNVRCN